ncbi:MAG: Capsule polysaccharide export protein [Candidatus Eremiobacteraeota bacterium]|jgi:protein involved in polysaccharide export with SLBB domain|nr:Capsule polysaccharide export protein [Candidatus Eremiobacteraeota bacterium]
MRNRRSVFVITAALLFSTNVGRAQAALHPGDKVDVQVYNHPELSGVRTLDAMGNVSVPVAGSVAAANLEPRDVADRIRAKLAPYVRQVAVQVRLDTQSESIFVAGGPGGSVKFVPGETLSSVVDRLQTTHVTPQAQSTTDSSGVVRGSDAVDLFNGAVDFRRVSVMREGTVMGPFDLLALRAGGQLGPTLAPNDTIQLVNKPIAVTITGDVQHPGIAYLRDGEPLAQALAQVGGASPTTSTQTGIVLDRAGSANRVSLGGDQFAQPAQNGDRLFVPRAPHVDVVGNVTKPGDVVLRGNPTLVSAIYYAGGPSQYANLKAVQVIHGANKNTYNLDALRKGRAGENPTLSDGDVVLVPQGSTFDLNQVWSAIGALGLFGLHI